VRCGALCAVVGDGDGMSSAEEEASWRVEFERDGERAVHDTIYHGSGIYPDPKRLAALRWLREQESKRALREEKMLRYVRRTLLAAVGAVIVGVVGVLVTWLHK
jgi:hypothetical protein